MNVKIIQVQRGKDSKLYPATMPLPRSDRIKIITRLHELCHGLGHSQREAQAILLAEGWRRSLGSICYDLSRPMPNCLACRLAGEHWRRAAAEAEQRPAEPSPGPAHEPEPEQQQQQQSPAGDGGQQDGPAAELVAWLAAHPGRELPADG